MNALRPCLACIMVSWMVTTPALAEKFIFKKDATSQTIMVKAWDLSSSTGKALTGLVYNGTNFTCTYTRQGSAPVTITKANQTVTGAYTSGGWIELTGTPSAPGSYRFDLPDAALAAGVDRVKIDCPGAANGGPTNLVGISVDIELEAVDRQSATNLGLSNLDATVSSRMATYTQPTGFLAATFPTTVASPTNITAGTITTVSGNVNGSVGSVTASVNLPAIPADWITAAGIAAGAIGSSEAPNLNATISGLPTRWQTGFYGNVTVAGSPAATTTSFASTTFSSTDPDGYVGFFVECPDAATFPEVTRFDPATDTVFIHPTQACPTAFTGTVNVWFKAVTTR